MTRIYHDRFAYNFKEKIVWLDSMEEKEREGSYGCMPKILEVVTLMQWKAQLFFQERRG